MSKSNNAADPGSEPKLIELQCSNCSTLCTKTCANCKKVGYCSVQCQKATRANHKRECFPAIEEFGRGNRPWNSSYWVATRQIAAGEIIFTDYPLMVGPSKPDPAIGKYTCLGCHSVIKTRSDVQECEDCGWQLCAYNCPMLQRHKNFECPLLTRNKGQFDFKDAKTSDVAYGMIRQIRCILLSIKDPISWLDLIRLPKPKTDLSTRAQIIENESAVKFFQAMCGLKNLSSESITNAIEAERSQSVSLTSAMGNTEKSELFLYNKGSRVDLSCVPNIKTSDAPRGKNKLEFGMYYIATVPIEKGERLTTSLLYGNCMEGTKSRREGLMAAYGFQCSCPRCSDPTELGTFLSAIKCQACDSGYLLPTFPLDQNSSWKCNLPQCSSTLLKGDAIDIGISKAKRELDELAVQLKARKMGQLFRTELIPPAPEDYQVLNKLEKFLEKYQKKLHPNHYLNFAAKKHLLLALGSILALPRGPDLSVNIREMRIQLIRKLKQVAKSCIAIGNCILPGLSLFRGRALYFLGLSHLNLAQEYALTGGDLGVIAKLLTKTNQLVKNLEVIFEHSLPGSLEEGMLIYLRETHANIVEQCQENPLFGLEQLQIETETDTEEDEEESANNF